MPLTTDEIIARVTNALRRADREDSAVAGAIETIYRCADLSYGEAWTRYRKRPVVYLKAAWHAPELDLSDFVTASKKIALAPGVGLAGRVWQSGRQEVIHDLRTSPDFSRQSLATAAGFRSAIGTPVFSGDEVCAVLVFLTPTTYIPATATCLDQKHRKARECRNLRAPAVRIVVISIHGLPAARTGSLTGEGCRGAAGEPLPPCTYSCTYLLFFPIKY